MNAPIQIEIRGKRLDELKFALGELERRMVNISPMLEKFAQWYQQAIGRWWDSKGNKMGRRWPGLSKAYAKRKQAMVGRRGADLQLTGRLKTAATGGAGWFHKIEGTKLTVGIEGIPYAGIHQTGGRIPGRGGRMIDMPQRAYFISADGGLPGEAIQKLIDLLREHGEGVIK